MPAGSSTWRCRMTKLALLAQQNKLPVAFLKRAVPDMASNDSSALADGEVRAVGVRHQRLAIKYGDPAPPM
jgi:hypothetical protein